MTRFAAFVLFIIVFSTNCAFAQGMGTVDDGFEKDYKNSVYPRDKNSNIINETELLKNISGKKPAAKIFIKNFEIMGNRVIPRETLLDLIAKKRGKTYDIDELNAVADIITRYYRDKGYIISYAYIPPQVVADSSLVINVLEGEIGSVYIEGLSEYKRKFIEGYLAPLKSGLILDSTQLERCLMLLNNYMDINARAVLRAGKTTGSADIFIQIKDANRYKVSLGFDNYGSNETSYFRMTASGMAANLIKIGDRLALNATMGLDNFNPQDLFAGRIDYRIPVGTDGVRLGLTYTRGNYNAVGNFRILDLNGASNEYAFYAEYPLLLRTDASMNFIGRLSKKDSQDNMLGERNTADGIYTVSASIYGDAFLWKGASLYYSLSLDQGLNPAFNGSNYSLGSSRPDAGGWFERFYFDAVYFQQILTFFRLNTFFSGQIASGAMFSSNKFYIGGMYSVRGFDSGANSGDNGVRASIEAEFDVVLPNIKAFSFLDVGYASNKNKDIFGYKDAFLASVGVGVKYYPCRFFSIKAEYGLPIAATQQKLSAGAIYAKISFDF